MPGGRALVLGGGGVAGIAWMTRVLAGLARAVFSSRAPGCGGQEFARGPAVSTSHHYAGMVSGVVVTAAGFMGPG